MARIRKTTESCPTRSVERRSGVALWRQIADDLRTDIATGNLAKAGCLPPELELAANFGVNRHTVRAAITALSNEGIVESRQGQGTFIKRQSRLVYPISRRTRFAAGLANQAKMTSATLLDEVLECATQEVANALELTSGAAVLRLDVLSTADGLPVSRSTNYFAAARFSGIARAFAETGSFTQSLNRLGIADYVRQSTLVEARHATMEDASDLKLSPGAIVLITKGINADLDGQRIQYAVTRFPADRVSLTLDNRP